MIFEHQKIKGVFLIKHKPHLDKRGAFSRVFSKDIFKKNNLDIKQTNISINKNKFTLRGFHYQLGKYSENKLVTCLAGEVYDIVLDLRKNSKTYKKWISLNLKKFESVLVPKGCANAFLTLVDQTYIFYHTNKFYNPKLERGVRFNDPQFNFKWPHKPFFISKKDKHHPNYSN